MNTLMGCGHTAQGTTVSGEPVCVICYGIREGATTVIEEKPSLEGRRAICGSRGKYGCAAPDANKTVPSDYNLAFFTHQPEAPYDHYYCGCWGWD